MKFAIIILTLIILMSYTGKEHGTSVGISSVVDTVPSGVPQLFGAKYYKFNGYVLADSFLMTAAGDTNNVPYFPSLEFKSSNNRWYGWNRSSWQPFLIPADQTVRWCNVKNSGADTTGTVDASPYVTALINAGCKYIYMPAGTYLFSNTVQMRDSITIKGDGKATVIKLAKNIPAFKCGWALGGNKSSFYDLSFLGSYPQDSIQQDGIFVDSCNGVIVDNISAMKLAGWAVHLRKNGFCCGGYPLPTGVLGNMVSNCWIDSSYGGVMHDTIAEYNSTVNTTVIRGKYGIFVAGGNARIADCNGSGTDYGLVITGGSNNAHGTISNSHFSHCRRMGLYVTGATNGYELVACNIRQDSVLIENSDNIRFTACELGALDNAISIVNSTKTIFTFCRIWGTIPFGAIGTGTRMLSSDSTTNGISIVDLPAGKRFDMSYANGFVDFTVPPGGSYRFDDTIVTKYIAAGTANNDTLHMMATTRPTPTQSGIQFGVDNSANGVRAGYWDMRTGYLGVNTRSVAVPLHVRNLRPGANAELRLSEDTTCGSCAARLSFENNGAVSGGQIFVGSTTNAFMPRGMMIHTLGADGLKIATNGAAGNDIEFAGSVFIGTSSWGRFKGGTGDFLYNTTTDDPANGKFQIHSTSRFDSLMKLYNLALPPSTYNVLVHGLTDSGVYQIPVSSISGITSVNSETGPAITVTGGTAVSVGTTTNTVTVNVTPSSTALPHTLDAQFTTAGNSGTAETDLYSYTLPANKLLIDGRTMNFEIDGEFNDATATAQLKLYIAGNVTLNTSAIVISTAFTAWRLRGYLIRTSTTTAHVTYELQSPGLATPLFIGYSNLTSLDFTTTNIFKVTAQAGGVGGGTDDITAHSWQVLYKPQPQ